MLDLEGLIRSSVAGWITDFVRNIFLNTFTKLIYVGYLYEPKKRAIIYYQNLLYLVHGRLDFEDLIANSVDGWIIDFAK